MTSEAASENKTDKTLHDLFMTELADVYSAEKQLVEALPKMAEAAMAKELQEVITSHLKETEGHVRTVERVFAALDMKPKAKKCEAIERLLSEGDEPAASFKGSPACDAAIISACQKVEHYEIASYGCLKEWADLLGNVEASTMLEAILAEERKANESLGALARAASNMACFVPVRMLRCLKALACVVSNDKALEEYLAEGERQVKNRPRLARNVLPVQ